MKHRLSNSLITMIILPVLVCLVLLLLLLFAYESAWDTVEKVQKQGIRELVDLGSSAVERLWIAPRNYAMTELSKSPSLRRHLTGELELEVLFREWAAAHRAMEGAFFIYYGLADGSIELYPDLELP
ncbi:MAG TPA: hypothetical protein ENN41_06655, partial [Sediminispirochaeta sp.]|nr:hypothetical protein [Sediminispirochaeta sp.]